MNYDIQPLDPLDHFEDRITKFDRAIRTQHEQLCLYLSAARNYQQRGRALPDRIRNELVSRKQKLAELYQKYAIVAAKTELLIDQLTAGINE